MRDYDDNEPLIHMHIPKTGGISVRKVYEGWFGDNLRPHYVDSEGKLPEKYNLKKLQSKKKPLCVYGHFNRCEKFGIEDYYPDVSQFVTILRDPFEKAVSGFFYVSKNKHLKTKIPIGDVLSEYLLNFTFSYLNHFPKKITFSNYIERIETQFIEIGVTEYLHESMSRIAVKLNQPYNSTSLDHLNSTERDQRVPYELKDAFVENNPLEYAVYNYVLDKYR